MQKKSAVFVFIYFQIACEFLCVCTRDVSECVCVRVRVRVRVFVCARTRGHV
jgi:hypothetical protein